MNDIDTIDLSGLQEIDIDNIVVDKDESLWDKLIDEIIDGNVIPVIGPDMLVDSKTNLHQVIINALAQTFHLQSHPTSFSELIYDEEFLRLNKNRKDQIYYLVNKVFAKNSFPPSQRLQRLLSIRQFPFVITTSFTPVVEKAMRKVWGDELQVMRFNNNPSENDDIKSGADLRKPTVYYMFGKVGEGAHKYVLTDIDMLDFVSSWLSKNNDILPKNLCGELQKKYLLMLGTDYANWLFRFIWYSMRKGNLGQGMLGYDRLDDSLINFLERAETFTKHDTSEVIDQITARLDKKITEHEKTKFDRPEDNVDVFISYSRSDSDVASHLYDALTAQGLRVWYDRKNLTDGGDFMEEIRKAIRTSKYFVPILSDHVTQEKNDSHVYRNEWDVAIEVGISMGRTYIIPLAEEGFDFYKSAIPERMQRHNAITFRRDEGIEAVAEKIVHKMNES